MIYMFLSNNPSLEDINLSNLPCFAHAFPVGVIWLLNSKTILKYYMSMSIIICFMLIFRCQLIRIYTVFKRGDIWVLLDKDK